MSGTVKPSGYILQFPVYQPAPYVFDFLLCRLAKNHQQQLAQLFSAELVSVDNSVCSPGQPLATGQKVRLCLPEHGEEPVDTQWRLLWENDELMAVYKPHLLPVSRTTRNLYNTLISLLRRQTPYSSAHLLHRLDTETAGIVVLAKDSHADKKWKPKLDQLISEKVYQAWVYGCPSWQERTVECELSEKIDSPVRSQMYVVEPNNNDLYPKPKWSKTQFKLLRTEGERSLIECRLFSGRKHQIRAHLAYLGHPIVGDKIYSHSGRYYLKRIQRGLTDADMQQLGAHYHQLTAVSLQLQLDENQLISISLPESLLSPAVVASAT